MKMIDIVCIMSVLSLSSCTISFQNISTHGTATDLVDETQAPQTEAQVEVPLM
jgi:hypothetical protein